MQRVETEIIVLGYGLPDIERECFYSVCTNTAPGTYIFTYMDNLCDGLSLTQAWNKLIEKSQCEFICLLNSDTWVCPGWLSLLLEPLRKSKQIGFTGPSTNNCHSPQKQIATYEEACKHKDEIAIMKDPISGFCLVFSRALWKSLDGFDEKYKFYGAESDFIDRANKQFGYRCAWVKDAFVHHIGEASVRTSKMDVSKEREKAKEIYWLTRKREGK